MNELTKSEKINDCDSNRLYKRKTILYSSHDLNKLAEQSSKARLIQEVVGSDDVVRKSYEEHLYNSQNGPQQLTSQTKLPQRQQLFAAYPSRYGLRWNPCIQVNSEEEIPTERSRKKQKSSCKCENCTSRGCPSKSRPFKDNIMRFCDKNTMTLRLNNASCSAKTPVASPKMSNMSMKASNSQTKFPKPICKKSCLQTDCFDSKPSYDEVERDTDVHEECPILQKAYSRHFVPRSSNTYESGKINIYNEGISDKVIDGYPVNPPQCPPKIRHSTRAYCRNKCPNCCCKGSTKHSKYHQRCKLDYTNRPIYYDVDNEGMDHFVAIPGIVRDRYVVPSMRLDKTPSIQLPKKTLTSERDVDAYIHEKQTYTRSGHKKFK